ncbi:hypothetical protein [Kitasatospora sp. NPDC088346]|uniref:hypothetical protein n=1 Tax=Kitasatospora sp. NPDC088346 TaxID=3364073 RepID=UPI0037FEE601
MAYRYRCGECGFKTSWGTESQGERQQSAHYADRHTGLVPGGLVETNTKNPDGGNSCLTFVAVAILLLLLAASCHR